MSLLFSFVNSAVGNITDNAQCELNDILIETFKEALNSQALNSVFEVAAPAAAALIAMTCMTIGIVNCCECFLYATGPATMRRSIRRNWRDRYEP